MEAISSPKRQQLGALLDRQSQESVMRQIPQFAEAQIHNLVPAPEEAPGSLGSLVFNMERGVHLEELGDFLLSCPDVRPFDVILANELDDGCVRSGGRDTARELAERLGLNYVYALEFIELVNQDDPKGYHGNAVFSRWPIRRAAVVRLPEQYNWYFDRQRRIGGRCAVLAEIEVAAGGSAWGSIHLEKPDPRPRPQGPAGRCAASGGGAVPRPAGDPGRRPEHQHLRRPGQGRHQPDRRLSGAAAAVPGGRGRLGGMPRRGRGPGLHPGAPAAGGYPAQAPALGRRAGAAPGLAAGAGHDGRGQPHHLHRRADCGFAPAGSALERFTGEELSDHNAVWALCGWQAT